MFLTTDCLVLVRLIALLTCSLTLPKMSWKIVRNPCACEHVSTEERRFEITSPDGADHNCHALANIQSSSRWTSEHQEFVSKWGSQDSRWASQTSQPVTTVGSTKDDPRERSSIHFVAGGAAGCASTLVTCPIDVIKTRQQSSMRIAATAANPQKLRSLAHHRLPRNELPNFMTYLAKNSLRRTLHSGYGQISLLSQSSIFNHCSYIWKVEGPRAFYKGLAPSLIGVVPSRAIYFCTYEGAKKYLSGKGGLKTDSSVTHVVAASCGGLACTTATCPVWVLKTKQQLHKRLNNSSLSLSECIRRTWATEGVKGFYRGLSASYAGIFETVLYFTFYERLKSRYLSKDQVGTDVSALAMCSFSELPALMILSSASKVAATTIAYPHEVARTRLREETVQKQYRGFWQTLQRVHAKEGVRALYAGLPAQLVRQVPNMAIVMGVYEAVVYVSS